MTIRARIGAGAVSLNNVRGALGMSFSERGAEGRIVGSGFGIIQPPFESILSATNLQRIEMRSFRWRTVALPVAQVYDRSPSHWRRSRSRSATTAIHRVLPSRTSVWKGGVRLICGFKPRHRLRPQSVDSRRSYGSRRNAPLGRLRAHEPPIRADAARKALQGAPTSDKQYLCDYAFMKRPDCGASLLSAPLRRRIGLLSAEGPFEIYFRRHEPLNLLKTLISDERIQGNPNKSKR